MKFDKLNNASSRMISYELLRGANCQQEKLGGANVGKDIVSELQAPITTMEASVCNKHPQEVQRECTRMSLWKVAVLSISKPICRGR